MSSGTLAYKVEDRSLLLPYYRRFLVDPLLPFLPRTLSPNAITHAGHVLNLMGTALLITLWPQSGWPFVLAALLVQAYLWCDNADGAHARRTGQCSQLGEFLDHSLDQVNMLYISYLTAMALGAPPLWWVLIALLIPGAGGVAFWEQSQTGVFRLGLLNQIESVTVLSFTLLVSAVLGRDIWQTIQIGGVTLQLAILAWALGTIVFGMVRSMMRVARTDFAAVMPVLVLIAFGATLAGAAATGALSTVAAVIVATAGNLAFGMRMLVVRLRKQTPRVDLLVLTAALVQLGLIAWAASGQPISPHLSPVLAALACAAFGAQAALDARDGVQCVARMEQTAAVPALK